MWRDLYLFVRQSLGMRAADRRLFDALEIGRCFTPWVRSLANGASALVDRRPWLTLPAIRWVEQVVTSETRVFEYGAGGSTLFFAEHARSVHTVEHDPDWAIRVRAAIAAASLSSATIELVEPTLDPALADADPADPDAYVTSDVRLAGYSFHRYVTRIDRFADCSFDLILVDGRARPACLKHAMAKVRIGGHLVLDNSERKQYRRAMDQLSARHPVQQFPGPLPYVRGFGRTTVWRRDRDQDGAQP